MTLSWRESASPQTQDDLDSLLDTCLQAAQRMLDKRGEFFPFAAAVATGGETKMIAGDPGHGEHPESVDVLATIVAGLRNQRNQLRAVAIVSDVRLAGSDAVRVELEHREGQAIAVLLPYKKKWFGRGLAYGELAAGNGEPHVWRPDRAPDPRES